MLFKKLDPTIRPNPTLSPEQVIKIQLDALQNNDLCPNNNGVRIAFRFASPANQVTMGPIERFIHVVKNPDYCHMIGFEIAKLDPPEVVGNRARQNVTLFKNGRMIAFYRFVLSKQREKPYADCWMTDSVYRLR